MESKGVGFCSVVAVLGIISAATGLAGEFTRVKASDISIQDDSCVYPSSPALALGIVSAVFAIITQVYISVTIGGCRYCCANDPTLNPASKLFSGLSRAATVIGVILLLAAAALNNKGGQVDSYGYFTCYVVKPGIFAAGGLALLSAVFGIVAYVALAPPATQTTTSPAVALPVGVNADPEKSPVPFLPQQHPNWQYA
ncbi:protein MODIFYING WALL LIGNIN-1-like [Bidens hawaiensis]|uniref:protein MODIFYING WALL LIGNIN-1-like n=1 Tax=Bidens hawaiensis TaxID=980011 RepID=UPI00404947F0